MTIQTLATTDVRRQQAEGRLLVIRNALEVADQELVKVLADRDWEVFGLPSFRAYCEELLPDLQVIKLRTGPRRERIRKLLEQDPNLSRREAAAAAGCDVATAHRDMDWLQRQGVANPTPSPAPAQKPSGAAQVRAALVKSGADGVTTPELVKALRLHWGVVSGELSRCAKNGRALLPTTTRDGFAVYVGTVPA